MDIINFIPEEFFIIIVTIYVLGVFLKKMENVKDKYITLILFVFGVTIAILLSISNTKSIVTLKSIVYAAMQGILCWGVSVGVNQTFKQIKKEE